EDVLPNHQARTVEEAVDDVLLPRRIPAGDRELPMAARDPRMPVDGWIRADFEPLRPRLANDWQMLILRLELRREDDVGWERAYELRGRAGHRVEHHAVGVERANDLRELVVRARIPRVVVQEHANAVRVKNVAHVRP